MTPLPAAQGLAVLVIEDEPMLLKLMAAAFRDAGYRVHTAREGGAGLSIFHTRHIDLVVTDLVMPGKEGIETILALKRSRADLKIIAISGGIYGRAAGYLTLARHLGADAVLLKPFHNAVLVAAAGSLMAHDGSRPELAA